MLDRSGCLVAGFLALACGGIWLGPASAQAPSAPNALKSEIYFGLRAADGASVDQQAWERFLTEVVVPRFPDGLTVVEASGRSGRSSGSLNPTRVLVVVHLDGDEAQSRIREIKAEYSKRFSGTNLFHTDHPVRVHSAQ